MEAKDLIGRSFKIVNVNQDKVSLTLVLEDPVNLRRHRLTVSEKGGPSASHTMFNWAEVQFNGETIFKS